MFKISVTSNFDTQKLMQRAQDDTVRQIEEKCKRAAAPYGSVQITVERTTNGMPSKVLLDGKTEAVEAARRALS